jgi:hypothetical protein
MNVLLLIYYLNLHLLLQQTCKSSKTFINIDVIIHSTAISI